MSPRTRSKPKTAFAPFNTGTTPTILLINQATTPLGCDLHALCTVLQSYVDDHLGSVWGVSAQLEVATSPRPGCWIMYFLDDADQPGALGYHDLTKDHLPVSKVFVRTCQKDGESVSVTASHELAEVLMDPAINLMAQGPDGTTIFAWEVCDACEETTFEIDGMPVSNFVYPSWFEGFRAPKSTQFDHLKLIDRPFKLLKGGYMPVMLNGRWTQIFGSVSKKRRFSKEDRRGHRSELRSFGGLPVHKRTPWNHEKAPRA